jgi:cyclase
LTHRPYDAPVNKRASEPSHPARPRSAPTSAGEKGAGGELVEVVDGVLAWLQPDGSWWLNNAGAITGPDGVILIDTCATETRTRALFAALAQATGGAPIRLAVNTHLHGDHTYGNSLLPGHTVLVSHPATRAGILADPIIDGCPPFWNPAPDWGNVTRRPATVTVSDQLTLHTGDRRVELRHPGYAAHTAGDLVAWLPEQRVLFTGDLVFHQVTPLVLMGSVAGALRSLDWLATFEPSQVVPGHGPLVGDLPAVLASHERYYRLIQDTARAGIDAGLSPLAAAKACDLGEFADLPDAERVVLNLHRAYADTSDFEFDLIRAITDAVEFNGGPLPCAL